eukprot:ANDGO_06613.mRNA.1 hypothetical protein H696_03479
MGSQSLSSLSKDPSAAVQSTGSGPKHLVVVCHGQFGFPSHVSELSEELRRSVHEVDPECALVHNSTVNRFLKTYDGIVSCGNRLFKEVLSVVDSNPSVISISFVGYSAGGLFSRYCIGRLFAEGWLGPGKRLVGMTYVSMATRI